MVMAAGGSELGNDIIASSSRTAPNPTEAAERLLFSATRNVEAWELH